MKKLNLVLASLLLVSSAYAQQPRKFAFGLTQFIEPIGAQYGFMLMHGKSDRGETAVLQVNCNGGFSFKTLEGRISINTGANFLAAQSLYVSHKYSSEAECAQAIALLKTASAQSPVIATVGPNSDIQVKSGKH